MLSAPVTPVIDPAIHALRPDFRAVSLTVTLAGPAVADADAIVAETLARAIGQVQAGGKIVMTMPNLNVPTAIQAGWDFETPVVSFTSGGTSATGLPLLCISLLIISRCVSLVLKSELLD